MEKYGFVYIWFDRKHKRYYVGSHWGTIEDGYVCSSSWMKKAYKIRPQDFKRRILSYVYTNRTDLYESETRFLSMMKEEEIRVRYYNLNIKRANHWSADECVAKSLKEKISEKTKEAICKPEIREKYLKGLERRDNKSSDKVVVEKRRQSMIKTMAEKFPVENRKSNQKRPTKQEISQSLKSAWNRKEETEKQRIINHLKQINKGAKHRLGHRNSEKHREKISKALKGKTHTRHKIFINNVEYKSTTEASKVLGLSISTINRRIKSVEYKDWHR
jgi:hypothetical protein